LSKCLQLEEARCYEVTQGRQHQQEYHLRFKSLEKKKSAALGVCCERLDLLEGTVREIYDMCNRECNSSSNTTSVAQQVVQKLVAIMSAPGYNWRHWKHAGITVASDQRSTSGDSSVRADNSSVEDPLLAVSPPGISSEGNWASAVGEVSTNSTSSRESSLSGKEGGGTSNQREEIRGLNRHVKNLETRFLDFRTWFNNLVKAHLVLLWSDKRDLFKGFITAWWIWSAL